MKKLLAVAMLGTALAFASSAAFADDRGVVEPISQPAHETTITQNGSDLATVAGAPEPISVVDTSRENGNNR